MKGFLKICILLFSALSCKKDQPALPELTCVPQEFITSQDSSFYIYYKGLQEHGWAKAIKLNREWEATAKAKIVDGKLDILFYTYISEQNPVHITEETYLLAIPLQKNCYVMTDVADSSLQHIKARYLAVDHDAIEDGYDVIKEDENYLEIDSLDLANKFVSGRFMATYLRDTTRRGRPYNPDTVRFFNGVFECRIVD